MPILVTGGAGYHRLPDGARAPTLAKRSIVLDDLSTGFASRCRRVLVLAAATPATAPFAARSSPSTPSRRLAHSAANIVARIVADPLGHHPRQHDETAQS